MRIVIVLAAALALAGCSSMNNPGSFVQSSSGASQVQEANRLEPPAPIGPPPQLQQPAPLAAPAKLDAPPRLQGPVDLSQYGREVIVVSTPLRKLYYVDPAGVTHSYDVGVGRNDRFTWGGVVTVTAKKKRPDWTPPAEMIERQPNIPRWVAGGSNDNPLGARALYLGSTLYRIHGSNQPQSIGHAVSSGCFRMHNADVIKLYEKVKVGTKVVVLK